MKMNLEEAGVGVHFDELYDLTTIEVKSGQNQVTGELEIDLGQLLAVTKLLDVLVDSLESRGKLL